MEVSMFASWVRRLFRKPSRTVRRAARGRNTFRPSLEWLGGREVPGFLAPASFPAGTNPAGIAVGDFNGDGKADMAVVNQALAGTVGVMLSNGDGTFGPPVAYAAGANPVD